MPLLDLYKIAPEQDWDFLSQGSLHALDFADGLRQAGVDGAITMWGRLTQQLESLTKEQPLLKIPADHWKDYRLDELTPFRLSTTIGDAFDLKKENFPLRTKRISPLSHEGGYADVHIDRGEAVKWLKWEGSTYIGRHKQHSP